MTKKPVSVVKETPTSVRVLRRFRTVKEAEQYIATTLTKRDSKGVYDGVYGIDAPESVVEIKIANGVLRHSADLMPDYGAEGQPGQIEFNGVQQVLRKADLEMILSGLEILEPDSDAGERRRKRLEAIFQAYTD